MSEHLIDAEVKGAAVTAPAHTSEGLVIDAWHRAFGGSRPNSDSSILDARGGYGKTLRFLGYLENATGRTVSISAVLNARTLRAIANVVESGVEPSARASILVKDGGDAPPLFILPGLDGSIFELLALGRDIRHSGPTYTNLLAGLDGRTAPQRSVAEIADYQVAEIKAVRPTGPYRLLGYSFGGMIGVEVARRLAAMGDEIDFFGMLEPGMSERVWPLRLRLQTLYKRTVYHVGKLRGMSLAEGRSYLADRVVPLMGRIRRILGSEDTAGSPYRVGGLPSVLQEMWEASLLAYYRYRPERYAGDVSFIQSEIGDPFGPRYFQLWSRHMPRITLYTVPGTHWTMLRGRNGRALAKQVTDLLDKRSDPRQAAQSSVPPPPTALGDTIV